MNIPVEINKRIVTYLGWKDVHIKPDTGSLIGLPPAKTGWRVRYCTVPNYHGDLNAMHEAQKVLNEVEQRDYAFRILLKTDIGAVVNLNDSFRLLNATAAQRAEAFLRTIGQWEGLE